MSARVEVTVRQRRARKGDINAAHAQLRARGVDVTEVQVLGENLPGGDPLDNVGFVFFNDPDGNGWAVQQISSRD